MYWQQFGDLLYRASARNALRDLANPLCSTAAAREFRLTAFLRTDSIPPGKRT
jgi:hypothetical protein